jgi:hypothetical protein
VVMIFCVCVGGEPDCVCVYVCTRACMHGIGPSARMLLA